MQGEMAGATVGAAFLVAGVTDVARRHRFVTSSNRAGNLRTRAGEQADDRCAQARRQVQRSRTVCEKAIGLLEKSGEADPRSFFDELQHQLRGDELFHQRHKVVTGRGLYIATLDGNTKPCWAWRGQ